MLATDFLVTNKETISKLCFGAAPLGGVYGEMNQELANSTVSEALKQGINLFDTSPYYGNSEEVLGNALINCSFPRDQYLISTKVGRYGLNSFDYSKETVEKSIGNSLKLLNTEYLDIVYCHDVEFVSLSDVIDSALPKLFELKRQGIIRHVGISGYPLHLLEQIASIMYQRGTPLDAIMTYCHYNLQNTSLVDGQYINQFHKFGVKLVFNASPLCMGLLSPKYPDWHPAPEELKQLAQKCVSLCADNNTNLPNVATKFALRCPSKYLTATVIGCSSPDQVKGAIKSLAQAEIDSNISLANECQTILNSYRNYSWPSPPE